MYNMSNQEELKSVQRVPSMDALQLCLLGIFPPQRPDAALFLHRGGRWRLASLAQTASDSHSTAADCHNASGK